MKLKNENGNERVESARQPEPSVVGAGGLITHNGSCGFGVGGDLYLKKSGYEIKAVYARGNIEYDLYGVGYANGPGVSVWLPSGVSAEPGADRFRNNQLLLAGRTGIRFLKSKSIMSICEQILPGAKLTSPGAWV